MAQAGGAPHTSIGPIGPISTESIGLIGLERSAFDAVLQGGGIGAASAAHLWRMIYRHGLPSLDDDRLSARLRRRLAGRFVVGRPGASLDRQSADGTRKWLFDLGRGAAVETVHIPDDDDPAIPATPGATRGALCLSSQVGCTLNCRFCHTGTQALVRNLSAAEIIGQAMAVRDVLSDWTPYAPAAAPVRKQRPLRRVATLVMMGMGEPLLNYDAVATALRIAMDGEGFGLSRRRITLSTAGVVPMIHRCGAELGVTLAVSLHAVSDDVRDRLVPLNRKYPIAELLRACRAYPGLSNARRMMFEYVMLKGVNDGAAEARALVALLKGIPAKVNLIPFNPWPGSDFACATPEAIRRFADIVSAGGLSAPVRQPRGRDILAACGQLCTESMLDRRPAA